LSFLFFWLFFCLIPPLVRINETALAAFCNNRFYFKRETINCCEKLLYFELKVIDNFFELRSQLLSSPLLQELHKCKQDMKKMLWLIRKACYLTIFYAIDKAIHEFSQSDEWIYLLHQVLSNSTPSKLVITFSACLVYILCNRYDKI
jgi:hypothetical protein